MENLLLTLDEQKVVLKFKKILERKFKVSLHLPHYTPTCEHDVVVATVYGGNSNLIKSFIDRKMNQIKQRREQNITVQNSITTITLSDSDAESSFPVLTETQQTPTKRRNKRRWRNKRKHALDDVVDLSSMIIIEDGKESGNEESVQKRPRTESLPPVETNSTGIESPEPVAGIVSLDNTEISEISSEKNIANDTIILSDSPPPPDFISLRSEKEKENIRNEIDDSVIIIEDEIPKPLAIEPPKRLRPIVIDGSNVAREHGKITNSFSSKGIKIAIDYFLQRGHSEVTAFVPNFRRHTQFGPVLTTDKPLLEELAKEQRVVFTPSRRIENKRVTCYDDRFIVDLATKNGGVILSNDNYRDIAAESEEYKKTVYERLLMFCFVGDIIMIPQDPLGREGPSLDNFLSFPN